jgi:hypothetical protein
MRSNSITDPVNIIDCFLFSPADFNQIIVALLLNGVDLLIIFSVHYDDNAEVYGIRALFFGWLNWLLDTRWV